MSLVALELGPLVGLDGVLDGERVQPEDVGDLGDLVLGRLVQADPDEVAGLAGPGRGARGSRRRPRPGSRRGRARCRRSRAHGSPHYSRRHGNRDPGPTRPDHGQRLRRPRRPARRRAARRDRARPGRARRRAARRRAAGRGGHQPARAVPADGRELIRSRAATGSSRRDRPRASPSATTATGRAGRSRSWPRRSSGRPCRPSRRRRRSRAASRWPAMQARAVAAVRRRDAAVEAEHGAGAVWVAVSHGDIIKSVLADALGMHLDLFQRIHVDPASISIVRYTGTRPYVLATNTHAGDLSWLAPPPAEEGPKRARRRRARRRRSAVARALRPPPRVSGMPRRPRLRPAGALRRRHRRPARTAHVLPPGPRRRAPGQRRPREAAGRRRWPSAIDELLDEVMSSERNEAMIPAVAPLGLDDAEPLEQPIEEEFRAGTMTLSWDPADERVVIEVFPYTEAAIARTRRRSDDGLRGARARRGVPGPAPGRRRRGRS